MIKIIPIFAIACVMMSCNDNAAKQAQMEAEQKTVDSMRTEMVKKQTIDSMNAISAQQVPVNNEQETVSSVQHSGHRSAPVHNSYTTNTTNYSSAPAPVPEAVAVAPAPVILPAEPPKKKGWSAKAKGTLIGTGVGALSGALIDKNKGAGALIGGAIGAATGLGAGAIIDKKQKDKENNDK